MKAALDMTELNAALDRMAHALALPIETSSGFIASAVDQKRLEECVELVEAFQLLDTQSRQRCLSFAKDEVQRSLRPEA